jgi:hypothetical protein
VRHAVTLVSDGTQMNHRFNEKAPGACNTEGLGTNTNNLNSATVSLQGKAIATQIAQLALRGHSVHQLTDGGYLVWKYGYTYHAPDFEALQVFARRLGVSQ